MGDNNLILTLLLCLVLTFSKALALPVVKHILTAWTRLYTAAAPKHDRNEQREQVESYFHDQVQSYLDDGYHPAEAAVNIFLQTMSAVPSDIAWSLSYLPSAAASKLEKGSQKIRLLRTPKLIIFSVALVAMMNTGALVSDTDPLWRELLTINIGAAGAIALTRYQDRVWTRRVITCGIWVTASLFFAFLTWTIIQHRLYATPIFAQSLLHFVGGVLPLILAIALASNICRDRVFKGHWWPVFVAWFLIAGISIVSAVQLHAQILLVAWAAIAIGLISLAFISGVFYGGTTLAYLFATRASATGMMWTANSIRRLTQ